MKKRLLSALLALALVFVLLPTTALAEVVTTNGDISIAGKCWNFTKSTSGYETVYYQVQSNNGVFSTSLDNKTGCVWPTNPYLEITRTGNTITVIVHNKVTITTNKGTNNAAEECIEVNKSNNQTTTLNLVIKGAEGTTNNTLTLECKSYGSALSSYQGGITITGGVTVNAKSTYTNSSTGVSARAINVFNGDLTISGTGTTVNAENKDRNHPTIDVKNAVTISDGATLTAKNTNGGKAISCRSITADGYDFMGRSGNSGSYTTLTGDDKATKLQEYSSIQITPTPTPALEKSNVYVAGTNLYKNTAYTIQNGKPVMGGTYPGNYNIYFDATDYVLHLKDANIDARGTTGIYGTSDIVFVGVNSITASTYGIYSYFTQSDLKISGTGSLEVKTIAGDPAIATAYDTSRSIIISGNDFTVTADTSGTTSYAIKSDKDLTITGGAAVTAKSNATRAIDVNGSLTVTGASLTATSASDSVPTVQVGGNASFTGSTVTITNNSTTQGKSGKNSYEVSTGLYVGGTLDIKNAAKVTSTVIGGNAIYAKGDITISGDNTEVNAQNSAYKFSAISTNKTVNISDNSTVKAENLKRHQGDPTGDTDPSTGKTYNPCPAIAGKIANKNSQNKLHIVGFTTSSAGSQNPTEGTPLNRDIAPGSVEPYIHHYNVTITRGDEVARTESPVVIAGTTLLNDTYYTINGSTVAEGTDSNYNAFYDSATKTLKLNNAKISHSFAYEDGGGQDGAIIFKEFENYFIELSGENTISSTNTYAINCHRPDRTLTIKNAAEAENAKLTLTSNWMVICSIGGLNIQSDVTMVNTKRADYLMYVNGTFSYTGYNAYASTEASGSPLEVYNPQNYSTYKYLRVTKENLAPTTPTTYTVTITAGDNMKRESGALTQEVTKGAAITEVKFMAASGHYFPADYVSKMNLPAGLTAEIRENSWYLIISGTPTSDVTINLPAASVRPTITVSMPTPVAGNTPATANDITLTYSDINKSISKNLTISNVVWQSYVPNGDGSITPGEALSSGDKFEAGKTYFVRITHEYVAGDYDIVPAAGITLDYTESDSTYMMLLFYTTGAPCNHEYTNDWLANGNTHWHECKLCRAHAGEVAHTFGDWITDTPATDTTDGSKHRTCSVCQYQENATIPKTGTGEIVPPTPDNPGTIVIIRPAEEEKPAQQPNPSTGANDLVGLAVAAAVAAALGSAALGSAALGSAALLRKHD